MVDMGGTLCPGQHLNNISHAKNGPERILSMAVVGQVV